jgi:hypothetical protein
VNIWVVFVNCRFLFGTCQFRDWQKPILRLAKADFQIGKSRCFFWPLGSVGRRTLVSVAYRTLGSVGYRILGSVSTPLFGSDFTDLTDSFLLTTNFTN